MPSLEVHNTTVDGSKLSTSYSPAPTLQMSMCFSLVLEVLLRDPPDVLDSVNHGPVAEP